MAKKKTDQPLVMPDGYITQAEAARRIKVSEPTMSRLKQAGLSGIYPEGVEWDVFLQAYIQHERDKAVSKLKNQNANKAEAFGKIAMARERLRKDQIRAGLTIYVHDLVDIMEEVAGSMRQAQSKLSRSMAVPTIQLFTEMLLRTVSGEEAIQISKALDGIDQAEVERFIQKLHDRNLGDLGERFRQVLPKAIERAKESKS